MNYREVGLIDVKCTDAFGMGIGVRRIFVHVERDCDTSVPACIIHRPSNHPAREWELVWRDDKGCFERTCPHGIGHPDPDDLAYHVTKGRVYMGVHGCDGCCGLST